jgi:DNA-binding NtrC family response regulator
LYRIRAVGDGYGLLCELQRGDFDLLLLDLGVPDFDGIQLLKQARELRPALEAVVVTDCPSLKGAVEAADLGAGGYLQKPVERGEFLGCVEKALGAGVGQKPMLRSRPASG